MDPLRLRIVPLTGSLGEEPPLLACRGRYCGGELLSLLSVLVSPSLFLNLTAPSSLSLSPSLSPLPLSHTLTLFLNLTAPSSLCFSQSPSLSLPLSSLSLSLGLSLLPDLVVGGLLAEMEAEKRFSSPKSPEEEVFLATAGDLLPSPLSVKAPNTETPPTGF